MPRPDAVRRVQSYSGPPDGFFLSVITSSEGNPLRQRVRRFPEANLPYGGLRRTGARRSLFKNCRSRQIALDAWAKQITAAQLSSSEAYAVRQMRLFPAFRVKAPSQAPDRKASNPHNELSRRPESNLENLLVH